MRRHTLGAMITHAVAGLAALALMSCSNRPERRVEMDPASPSAELVRVDSGSVAPSPSPSEEPSHPRESPPTPPPTARRKAAAPRPEPEPPAYQEPEPDTTAPAGDAGLDAVRALPVGTEIHAALDDSLHSRHDSAGRRITAQVMENVADRTGEIVVLAGAQVRLTVTRLAPAGSRSASDGELVLRVDDIRIGDSARRVTAEVRPIPHQLQGRGVTGPEAARVGAGAAVGAVAGRVIGGDTKGAVVGGVAGGAGGAAVAAQTAKRDVVVKPGTAITFVLDAPLVTAAPLE